MEDEAEKVINISLCKMASSRGFRRGGSSLHKHLLIASVLTKARSAYLENWYMGENEYGSPTDISESEPSSTAGPSSNSGSNVPKFSDQSSSTGVEQIEEDEEEESMNNNRVLHPRLFVDVESEIELPADILNCVEKLGSLGEVDFLHNNLSASNLDVEEEINTLDTTSKLTGAVAASLVEEMVTDGSSSQHVLNEDFSPSSTDMESQKLTYLDLDAKDPMKINHVAHSSSSSNHQLLLSTTSTVSGLGEFSSSEPSPPKLLDLSSLENQSPRANFKRRRVSEDSNEYVSLSATNNVKVQGREPDETTQSVEGSSAMNAAKRIRIFDSSMGAHESLHSEKEAASFSSAPVFSSPSAQSFRSSKSLYGIQEEGDEDFAESGKDARSWQHGAASSLNSNLVENEDTDPFLGDSLGQTFLKRSSDEANRNDRRVPSTSSGCSSSSDEENEQSDSMEVDQITSLVQYFSFSQKKSLGNTASNPPSPTPPPSSGLIRSMSSPDLCNSMNNARCLIVTT